MKIDGADGHGKSHRPEAAESRGASRQPGVPAGNGRDRVEISGTARRMAGLIEAAGRLPEVREGLVAELREAIQSGTYEVESRRLAFAILEFEDGLYH